MRHIPASLSTYEKWHKYFEGWNIAVAPDRLQGNEEYGDPKDDKKAWAIKFDADYQQVAFTKFKV